MIAQNGDVDEIAKSLRNLGIECFELGPNLGPSYVGREQFLQIAKIRLTCAYQRNILLTGAAGVGKTTFVSALAKHLRIREASHDVLQYVLSINLSSLLAGTDHRGSFEKKLHQVFNLTQDFENIILFFDEAHIMKMTASEGGVGMMDLLKPLLLAQNVKVILATTNQERAFLIDDAAFMRRFHEILLPPLTEVEMQAALNSHYRFLSHYHGVELPQDNLVICGSGLLHEQIDELDFKMATERTRQKNRQEKKYA